MIPENNVENGLRNFYLNLNDTPLWSGSLQKRIIGRRLEVWFFINHVTFQLINKYETNIDLC
jgi:hypothetical protein